MLFRSVWIGALKLAGIEFEPWVDWLAPSLYRAAEAPSEGTSNVLIAMIGGGGAAAVGILLAWSWYARPGVDAPRKLAESFPRLHQLVFDKWRVDELYDATILWLSRTLGVVSAGIDQVVVDGLLARVSAWIVTGLGFVFTRMQNGLVQSYAGVMVAGLLALTLWVAVPHPDVDVPAPPAGDAVELVAQPGLGYQYRWDFDGDGHYEGAWSADSKASHTYSDGELQKTQVAVFEPVGYAVGIRHKRLQLGQRTELSASDLGPGWQRDEANDLPPMVQAVKEGLRIIPNGARLQRDGQTLPEGPMLLARGQHVDIGRARLTAAGIARGRVRVRNAFGVERDGSFELELPRVVERPVVEVVGMAEAHP